MTSLNNGSCCCLLFYIIIICIHRTGSGGSRNSEEGAPVCKRKTFLEDTNSYKRKYTSYRLWHVKFDLIPIKKGCCFFVAELELKSN